MKKITIIAVFSFIFCSYLFAQQDDIQERHIDYERLKLFPGYAEGKNYFFLQSINDKTQIVIGDFTKVDKKIILINLNDDYTTIKSVIEYNPVKNTTVKGMESKSKFFTTDIVKLKRDIITGAIFKGNNADDMKSYDTLENAFKENDTSRIFTETFGFSVRLTEIDEISKVIAMFNFGHTNKGYYLQFKTFYYRKNATTERIPVVKYSVYSKNTHDPIIQEYVEELFKIRKPSGSVLK